MNKPVACCAVLALCASSLIASAQDPKPGTPGPDGVRRDPAGQKGISPYHEALAKGRKLFQGQDYDGAIAAFQQAIELDAKATLGHLLLTQVHMAKGDLAGASQTLATARETRGTEALQSKLLMVQANVTERVAEPRQDKPAGWDQAKQAWHGYATFVAGHPKAPDYRATATERDKKIDEREAREKAYAIVRQRIADNAKKRAQQ